jgi:hypothetical protein
VGRVTIRLSVVLAPAAPARGTFARANTSNFKTPVLNGLVCCTNAVRGISNTRRGLSYMPSSVSGPILVRIIRFSVDTQWPVLGDR